MEPPGLEISKNGPTTVVKFNRPEKKNALSQEMLSGLTNCLRQCGQDPSCVMVVVTGSGNFFTSGNDLKNFTKINHAAMASMLGESAAEAPSDMAGMLKSGRDYFCCFVKSVIDFPKLLVAVVNGSAVGIGVTLLPLFDLVFVTDNVTLWTPFTSLGQVAEGCSSYTFPRLLGHARAADMLLAGRKVSGSEAVQWGLASSMVHRDELPELWARLQRLAESSPPTALAAGRMLMRAHCRDTLHKVNEAECDALLRCWSSQEFMDLLAGYFDKKSKL